MDLNLKENHFKIIIEKEYIYIYLTLSAIPKMCQFIYAPCIEFNK